MVRRTVEIHPEAVGEARAAREWYAERSPTAAEAFMVELDDAVTQITEAADRWPEYHFGTRRYLMRRFPYMIVFRDRMDALEIIAVAHGRRHPGYWRSRI